MKVRFLFAALLGALLALPLSAVPAAAQEKNILFVLWKGFTASEEAFKVRLAELGIKATYREINGNQDRGALASALQALEAEIEAKAFHAAYTHGTPATQVTTSVIRDRVPVVFDIVIGLIPDMATLRDRASSRRQRVLYGILALGWQGSSLHWREYRSAYLVLAGLMAPLVISVHSIVGLDFAGGLVPGWHETQFPPYFVFGAVLSGFAAVLMLVIPLRRALDLEGMITPRHLDVLARLMLTTSLLIGYSYGLEIFMPFYRGERAEITVVMSYVTGHYAPWYWAKIVLNWVVPQLLWFRAVRLHQPVLFAIAAGVVVGMWIERYVIVVASLHRNHSESSWAVFTPTFWDWATLAGSAGLFLTGFFLLLRFIPMVSMFEMRELVRKKKREGGR